MNFISFLKIIKIKRHSTQALGCLQYLSYKLGIN